MDEQTGPTLSSRALAIVHLAMYDAYAGVINDPTTLPRYITTPASPGVASEDAAVAAAAHATLSRLFPSQRPLFDLILSGVGNPADPGHNFGLAVA
jgi:vanadium chloroperoxidase